jgi:predicted RNA-binding protein with PIN domain
VLVRAVGNYSAFRKIRVVVAFDAMGAGGDTRTEIDASGVTIAYCGDREADIFLVEEAKRWLERRHPSVVIASNDGLVQDSALAVEVGVNQQLWAMRASSFLKDVETSEREQEDALREQRMRARPLTRTAKVGGKNTIADVLNLRNELFEQEAPQWVQKMRRNAMSASPAGGPAVAAKGQPDGTVESP